MKPSNIQPLKIYLDKQQHLLLKILCAIEEKKMNEVVNQLIDDWIDEKKELHRDKIKALL